MRSDRFGCIWMRSDASGHENFPKKLLEIRVCLNLHEIFEKLNKNGRLVLTEFGFPEMLRALWHSLFGSKKVIFGASNFHWKTEDLVFFNKLINSDELAAVVDRTYSLEQMPEAHRYVESGRKRGNVVIRLEA